MVFLASAMVHFLADGFDIDPGAHRLLENLDHFAIYLFIAGSYTPFVLSAIHGTWRTILLVSIWTLAVLGILYTALRPRASLPLLGNLAGR